MSFFLLQSMVELNVWWIRCLQIIYRCFLVTVLCNTYPTRDIPLAPVPSAHPILDSIKFFPSQSEAASAVTSVAVHLFPLISLLPQSFLSFFALPRSSFFRSPLISLLHLLDSSMVERRKIRRNANIHALARARIYADNTQFYMPKKHEHTS